MLEVLPIKDFNELEKFYKDKKLALTDGSGCVVARIGEEILGYCAYTLNPDKITVVSLEPTDDIMLADGVLRSALHIADFNGITNAFYSDASLTELFNKLSFIKDAEEKSLRIEKLKESCCSC